MPAAEKRNHHGLMLTTTSAIAILAGTLAVQPAHAQTAAAPVTPPSPPSQPRSPSNAAGPVAPEAILQELVVTARASIGGGNMIVQREPETTSSVDAKAISQKMALSGPLQIIASLPGIDYSQSDPFAMSQRSMVYIRGLPETEEGWLVEGMPATDQAYFVPYSESWVDTENLAGVTVIPGSFRITDPLETAVGGEVIETVRNPAAQFGADGSVSYGSWNTQRYFARIDTGSIGATGLTAFGSLSYSRAGTYNLPGAGTRLHSDVKLVKDWGDNVGRSSVFVSYSDWNSERQNVYSLATFAQQRAANDYTIGNYSATFNPSVAGNNFYKQDYYLRENVIVASQNEFKLSSNVTLHVDPYYQWEWSNSPGGTIVNPASLFYGNTQVQVDTTGLFLVNGRIPARQNNLQTMWHAGVNAYAEFNLTPDNKLLAGYWYDHWDLRAHQSLAPLNQNGFAGDNWGGDVLLSTTGQLVTGLQYNEKTDLNALFISDEQSFLDDRLKFDVGVKYFAERLSGVDLVPGAIPNLAANFGKWLPRATVSYDINSDMQVYADVVTSARPPIPINTYPNTYNVNTGRILQAGQPNTRPEYAVGEEIGYRYHANGLVADLAVFNKVVSNRQIIASAVVNGAGASTSLSAGTESIQGVTGEVSFRPIYGFTPYANAQYLHATTESNFAINGDFLPTKGLVAPGSPKFSATAGLYYRHGPFFGNVLYRYTADQYSTLMDDQTLPGYGTVDLGIGYDLPPVFGKSTVFRVDVTNVGHKPYLGAISGLLPNAKATTGINGSLIPAGTVTYFEGAPTAVMATLSASF